jgi:hypothetical protein
MTACLEKTNHESTHDALTHGAITDDEAAMPRPAARPRGQCESTTRPGRAGG